MLVLLINILIILLAGKIIINAVHRIVDELHD